VTTSGLGRWWRLGLGTIAFMLLTRGSLGLVALPLAALLVAAGLRRGRDVALAATIGAVGLAFVSQLGSDPLAAALGAYSLIVAAAFAGGALLGPTGVLRQSLRAMGWGALGTGLLGLLLHGSTFWTELRWSAVRQTSSVVRLLVERQPDAYALFEPLVRVLGDAVPALVALETFAGLALAWQWHTHLAATPLGLPLAAFRQFRFADHWVWGIVAALLIWAVPRLATLKAAALNLGLVLGVLYLLRGAAIVVAVAGTAGVPGWTLAASALAAGLLVVPLLVLVPALWTLGVFDTWLAFRQRRFGRPTIS
jgi:hypothetical protein